MPETQMSNKGFGLTEMGILNPDRWRKMTETVKSACPRAAETPPDLQTAGYKYANPYSQAAARVMHHDVTSNLAKKTGHSSSPFHPSYQSFYLGN